MVAHTLLGAALALGLALPLAGKWQLGLRTVGLVVAALSALAGLLVWLVGRELEMGLLPRSGLVLVTAVTAGVLLLAYRFYRDPERVAPTGHDAIVSPADGEVVYVRTSRDGKLPVTTKRSRRHELEELTKTPLTSGDALVIGISMSFADVHVQRAPIGGRVTFQKHFRGRFGSLRDPEMIFVNERATTVIERPEVTVAVVQIASRLVRRIVSFVSEGEEVALGQRIGVIRFGSQVDLVLPIRDDLRVTVRPGERLRAGESAVAVLERRAAVSLDGAGAPAPGLRRKNIETPGR